MKERPILFSTPMVKALLEGRKTQTRRIMKGALQWHGCLTGDCPHDKQVECDAALLELCPYGKPGDRLRVRETWAPVTTRLSRDMGVKAHYRADFSDVKAKRITWKPSIHLPSALSRIFLEVVAVRTELVMSCSASDSLAEGFHGRDDFFDTFFNLNKRAPANTNPWVWVVEFKRVV